VQRYLIDTNQSAVLKMSDLPLSIFQLSGLAAVIGIVGVARLSWVRRKRSQVARRLVDYALANRNLDLDKLSGLDDQMQLREAQHQCAHCKFQPQCVAVLPGAARAEGSLREHAPPVAQNASQARKAAIWSNCPNRPFFDALTRKYRPDTMRRFKINRTGVREPLEPH